MSDELARWAPGMSLEWAVVSLMFGVVIFGIIAIRLWREYREDREYRASLEEEGRSTPVSPSDVDSGGDDDAADEHGVDEHGAEVEDDDMITDPQEDQVRHR